jgi:uncharacterized protein involved in exopolysaccharide biosynthesis
MTLLDLFAAIARGWKTVAMTVVVCASCVAIAAFAITPIYRASVVLAPTEQTRAGSLGQIAEQLSGLASIAGGGPADVETSTGEAVATLRSRVFVDRFILEQGLLDELSAHGTLMPGFLGRSESSPQRAYQTFIDDVFSVRQDRDSGLYTLSIDWYDRERAARWANLLVERLNDETRRVAIERAERQIGYLNAELEKATVLGTREAVFRLLENEIKSSMIASAHRDFAFRVIDPAIAPEPGYFRWPRRGLMIFAGAVLGFALGALLVARPDRAATRSSERA